MEFPVNTSNLLLCSLNLFCFVAPLVIPLKEAAALRKHGFHQRARSKNADEGSFTVYIDCRAPGHLSPLPQSVSKVKRPLCWTSQGELPGQSAGMQPIHNKLCCPVYPDTFLSGEASMIFFVNVSFGGSFLGLGQPQKALASPGSPLLLPWATFERYY